MHNVGKHCGFRQALLGAGACSLKEESAQSIGAKDDGEKGVRDMKSLGAAILRKHTAAWKENTFFFT